MASKGLKCTSTFLARWAILAFTARLDYGIPLISVSSTDRTWQENGIYFSVFYNPF